MIRIKRIGERTITKKKQARLLAYKSIPWRDRIFKKMSKQEVKDKGHLHLFYHPIWLAKTLVIAERPPFPPKKMPNMIFVDAVSGYRGIFSNIPSIKGKKVSKEMVGQCKITTKEQVVKYIEDVQLHQINRSYLLKKPKHKIVDIELCYLPLWEVKVDTSSGPRSYFLNANTAKDENYMAKKWQDHRLLLQQ